MPQTYFWPTKSFRACPWNSSSSWLNDFQWKWFPTSTIRWFFIQGPDLLRFRQNISTTEAPSLAIQCFLTLRTSNTGGAGSIPHQKLRSHRTTREWPESKKKTNKNVIEQSPMGPSRTEAPPMSSTCLLSVEKLYPLGLPQVPKTNLIREVRNCRNKTAKW